MQLILPILGFGLGWMILYEDIGLLLPDVGDDRGLSALLFWLDIELRTLVMV